MRKDRFILGAALAVAALQAAGTPYPPGPQVAREDLAIVIEDYAKLPITDDKVNRISVLRAEPGGAPLFATRTFVSDLDRSLYILDRSARTVTTYIDFEAVFPKFVNRSSRSTGLATFAFDPDYEHNGRFYTVHLEGPMRAGSETPTNAALPGLDLSGGYATTPSVDPPVGTVVRHAILVEWTDVDITDTVFQGTAREVLRIGFTNGNHSVADMLFSPTAQPGDGDYGNLYLAAGDGGAGQDLDDGHSMPQRLDAVPGKILRITPDMSLRPADELSANGRYRIPTTGADANPFVALDLPGVKKEIFAYGFRNPQRMSWDPLSNVIVVADIGLASWEELNVLRKGRNYGFAEREGSEQLFIGGPNASKTGSQADPVVPFPDPDVLDVAGITGPVVPTYPVAAYSHRDGDAISGGFVYRGTRMPHLLGKYVFGDITTGRVLYSDLSEMLAADDGDAFTLAPIHELQILFDSPHDTPDQGLSVRRLFDVVADEFAATGGVAEDGAALPEPRDKASDGLDTEGVPYGGGRADIRLATDRDGELYLLSKNDGMIRALVGAVTGATTTTVTTELSSSPFGVPVEIDVHVHSLSGVPSGVVELFDGEVSLGAVSLAGGDASFTVNGLAPGSHSMTARYSGEPTVFLGSISLPVSHLVLEPGNVLLTVSIAGAGSVTSTPAGIACPGTCTFEVVRGSAVTLTAAEAVTTLFVGWSGACTGTGACTLTLDADAAVTATLVERRADIVTLVNGVAPSGAPGAGVAVTETTTNQGTALVSSSRTRYYLSLNALKDGGDVVIGTRSVALAAGASSTATTSPKIPAATALGAYYVIACGDDISTVAESDEQNNCSASGQTVLVSRPDLRPTTVGPPLATVAPGGTLTAADTVLNQGGHTAGASTTRYYLSLDGAKSADDVLLTGNRSVPSVAPGASSSGSKAVTVPAATPLGIYTLLACADDLFKVVELVETNNCAAAASPVQVGRPDLVVSSVSNPPPTTARGKAMAITVSVSNQGTAASKTSTVRFYFSADALKDGSDLLLSGTRSVGVLAPGATDAGVRNVTVPTSAVAGTYRVLACADDTGTNVELVEGNNCLASMGLTALP